MEVCVEITPGRSLLPGLKFVVADVRLVFPDEWPLQWDMVMELLLA